LFADRNFINRRNVSADTKHSYAQNKQMFMLAMEARVTAAAMTILGMEDINGKPSQFEYKFHVTDTADKQSKKKYLRQLASSIVDQFILDKLSSDEILSKLRKSIEENRLAQSLLQPDGRYSCRFPPCKKTFK
jgi:hypothetical protein